jgi:hypothetical protein
MWLNVFGYRNGAVESAGAFDSFTVARTLPGFMIGVAGVPAAEAAGDTVNWRSRIR